MYRLINKIINSKELYVWEKEGKVKKGTYWKVINKLRAKNIDFQNKSLLNWLIDQL